MGNLLNLTDTRTSWTWERMTSTASQGEVMVMFNADRPSPGPPRSGLGRGWRCQGRRSVAQGGPGLGGAETGLRCVDAEKQWCWKHVSV